MNLLSIAGNFFKKGFIFIGDHTSGFLCGAAIAGYLTTIPLAIKCHKKADQMFSDWENEKIANGEDVDFTTMEKIEVWAKSYWPVFTTFAISTAFVILAQRENHKKVAALEAGLISAQNKLTSIEEAMKEQLTEKEAKKTKDKADQKLAENIIRKAEIEGVIPQETGLGNQLCVDLFSGIMFRADIESIRRAYNDLNQERMNDVYNNMTALNSLYYYLGITGGDVGRLAVWRNDKDCAFSQILPDFVSGMTDKGEVYLGFRSVPEPTFIKE